MYKKMNGNQLFFFGKIAINLGTENNTEEMQ